MDMRQDALYAASLLAAAVHDVAVDIPGDQVATAGYLEGYSQHCQHCARAGRPCHGLTRSVLRDH